MAHRDRVPRTLEILFWISLAVLPYLLYGSLVGLSLFILGMLATYRQTGLDPLMRNGLLVITGLLLLSCGLAFNRGEAFLQLSNFLPFFLLFAVLPFFIRTTERLADIALFLVLSTVPINLISVGEYLLKAPWLDRSLRRIEWIKWVRSAPHKGRAMVMFDHPNVMASYLVLILGLGLGLIAYRLAQQRDRIPLSGWQANVSLPIVWGATLVNLIGIFCSGSRNGLLIALSQLVLFAVLVGNNRILRWTIALAVGGLAAASISLGFGVRRIAFWDVSSDPRVGIWAIAIDLIQERPMVGWGLGNFKFLYPDRMIDPNYPDIFHPHNFWLLLGSEAGIPAMVVVSLMVGFICYRAAIALIHANAMQRGILAGYLLAFWGCVGFALFDVTFYDARVNVLNWLLLSALYCVSIGLETPPVAPAKPL